MKASAKDGFSGQPCPVSGIPFHVLLAGFVFDGILQIEHATRCALVLLQMELWGSNPIWEQRDALAEHDRHHRNLKTVNETSVQQASEEACSAK